MKTLTKRHQMRELLCHTINILLENDLISLDTPCDTLEGCYETKILGKQSVITWREHSYDELRVSIWWGYIGKWQGGDGTEAEYYVSKPLDYKGHVKVCCSCRVERRDGKWIHGYDGFKECIGAGYDIEDIYCSNAAINELMNVPEAIANGYSKTAPYPHFYSLRQ